MTPSRYRGALAVWMLLIAYASLYPVLPLRLPAEDALAAFFRRPRYVVGFDIVLNVAAYVPLGTLACLYYRQRAAPAAAISRALALAAGLSFAMEACQLFIPTRVATVYDVLANAAGALAGALVFADPVYPLVTRPLGRLRERVVIAGGWGDAGMVLVALWLLAQLNPALPFFGAGNISGTEGAQEAIAPFAWLGVALGTAGFGLFISALLREPRGGLRITFVLLTAALWLKFAGASLMLLPAFSDEWASPARFAGLAVGLGAFALLRRFPRPGRIYLAMVTVLAGALFSKIFGAYSALEDLLALFRWPYAQLASFATLTRLLHELWPFAALIFLVALFFRLRRPPVP